MSQRTRRLVDDRSQIRRESRLEIQFVLDPAAGARAAEAIDARADLVQDLDGESSWEVRSTYLDDSAMTMTRAAHANPVDCVRVRIREYPRSGHAPPSRVWLEIKRRIGERTEKTRFPILRDQLEAVLAWDLDRALRERLEEVALEAVQRLRKLCEGEPLVPVAEVLYRRSASVLPDAAEDCGDCRLTLDHELRYRLPRLTHEYDHRDPTVCRDAHYLEVKGATPPPWLLDAVGHRAPENFSKFVLVTGDYLRYEDVLRRAKRIGRRGQDEPSSDRSA